MTKVHTIESFSVTHETTGQIGNHANLAMKYTGTLPNSRYLNLVDATLSSITMGTASYPNPCTQASQAASLASGNAGTQHAAGVLSTTACDTASCVTLNTVSLDSSTLDGSGGGARLPRYYAVCYSESTSSSTVPWVDSGIRVTVPEIVDFTVQSGYTGTPARLQTSEMLSTNRLSHATGQQLMYGIHTTSRACTA